MDETQPPDRFSGWMRADLKVDVMVEAALLNTTLSAVLDALLAAWVEDKLPTPPATIAPKTGRISATIRNGLLAKAKAKTKRERTTLSAVADGFLEQWLREEVCAEEGVAWLADDGPASLETE